MILSEKSKFGDDFDYKVYEDDGNYSLFYHSGFVEKIKGTKAAEIKNTGDEYIITVGEMTVVLDFSQAMNMMALLLLVNRTDKVKYTLFSEVEKLN